MAEQSLLGFFFLFDEAKETRRRQVPIQSEKWDIDSEWARSSSNQLDSDQRSQDRTNSVSTDISHELIPTRQLDRPVAKACPSARSALVRPHYCEHCVCTLSCQWGRKGSTLIWIIARVTQRRRDRSRLTLFDWRSGWQPRWNVRMALGRGHKTRTESKTIIIDWRLWHQPLDGSSPREWLHQVFQECQLLLGVSPKHLQTRRLVHYLHAKLPSLQATFPPPSL